MTLDDARAVGFSEDALATRVARGELDRVARGLLAIAGMPWTWERRALAALLTGGPAARLSHRAAAHLLGFDGFGECAIELTVPRRSRVRTHLAIVHTTTFLHRLDVARVGRFVVTSGARTIVDLAASPKTGDAQLSAAIGSAIRDGYTSELFLRERLAALRGRGRAGIRSIDRVLEGPIAHSHLERRFLRAVARAGLRAPETQQIFTGERVMRVDALWRAERLVVEVMGHRFHCTAEDLARDAHRRNELQEMGMFVLELTTVDLTAAADASMQRIRRTLAARSPPR